MGELAESDGVELADPEGRLVDPAVAVAGAVLVFADVVADELRVEHAQAAGDHFDVPCPVVNDDPQLFGVAVVEAGQNVGDTAHGGSVASSPAIAR